MIKLEYKQEEVEVCLQWLKEKAKKTKNFNRRCTSYGLKHEVEHWSQSKGIGSYIHEHSLIKAMEIAGFKSDNPLAERFPDSPRANFNISFQVTKPINTFVS